MGHTGWLGRHPSPYSMRYTGPLEDPASPWIKGTRGPLGVPRFFMGKEQGGILEGLARPYDRCRSHGVARPICSPTHQHCVLLAGPAISSQKRTAVKPGRAAPSMPYGFLSPCLYHAVWHDMTEGAEEEEKSAEGQKVRGCADAFSRSSRLIDQHYAWLGQPLLSSCSLQ